MIMAGHLLVFTDPPLNALQQMGGEKAQAIIQKQQSPRCAAGDQIWGLPTRRAPCPSGTDIRLSASRVVTPFYPFSVTLSIETHTTGKPEDLASGVDSVASHDSLCPDLGLADGKMCRRPRIGYRRQRNTMGAVWVAGHEVSRENRLPCLGGGGSAEVSPGSKAGVWVLSRRGWITGKARSATKAEWQPWSDDGTWPRRPRQSPRRERPLFLSPAKRNSGPH